MALLIFLLIVLIVFDGMAWCWGVNSRDDGDSPTWEWHRD